MKVFISGAGISGLNACLSAQALWMDPDSLEKHPFDLVIGADGLYFKVRKLAFGNESEFLCELGLYVSFYAIPNYKQT